MVEFAASLKAFVNDRWFVFVAAMWIQSVAGVGYLFGSISPAIKSSLNYNQKQLARLGVAKDLGDSVGFLAGYLCEILPLWAALLIGAMQNFVGYGWVWLIVTHRAPALPLWVMCVLIFVGTNGECYFNTASLVSCVQNFPKSRGPIVGILKGFAGLSGAILTQIYALVNSPDNSPIIFMVAVGPTMVVIALMFIVRPVGGHKQIRPSDGRSFAFVYSVCVVLAAYLMGVMIVEDIVDLKYNVVIALTTFLFVLLLLPIVIPVLGFSSDKKLPEEESLLPENTSLERTVSSEAILSEMEDEKPTDVDLLPAVERKKRMAQLQAKLLNAAAEGAVRVKGRKRPLRPHRGEDFTLMEALIKADLWLIFFSLLLGSGSGVTVIDNLGQMSQSLGYDNTHIFVSMISIWNFLGRIGGGYLSEIVVKDYIYPRPVALAVAQAIMAVGHMFFSMGWSMHVGTMLIGLGYGAHWAVVPATVSELFGLKNFGALYNFITIAMPAGSLVFSGVIASSIYDYEAEKQAHMHQNVTANTSSILMRMFNGALGADEPHKCDGSICFFLTSLIMSAFCIIAGVLSMILVRRTRIVYTNLYGKTGSSLSLL